MFSYKKPGSDREAIKSLPTRTCAVPLFLTSGLIETALFGRYSEGMIRSMSNLTIKIEGLPERVQRLADAIEQALPGKMIWVQSAETTRHDTIKIEGIELELITRVPSQARTEAPKAPSSPQPADTLPPAR